MNNITFEVCDGDQFFQTPLNDRLAIAAKNIENFQIYVTDIISNDQSIKFTSVLPEILESLNRIPLVEHTTFAFTANDYDKMSTIRDGVYELVSVLQKVSLTLTQDRLRILDNFVSFYLRKIRIDCEQEFPEVETAAISMQLAAISDLASSQLDVGFAPLIDMLLQLKSEIEAKRHPLYEKRLNLTKEDEYGFVDEEPWIKARSEFSARCLMRVAGVSLDESDLMSAVHFICVLQYIPDCLDTYDHNHEAECSEKMNESDAGSDRGISLGSNESVPSYERGIGYEKQCKERLESLGWEASATPRTGDRGVDIVVAKRGLRVAIQCKSWASNVGASAVQEIYTGARIYKCDFGAVMSESPLTEQAREMARELGVILVSLDDVQHLEILIIKNMQNKIQAL